MSALSLLNKVVAVEFDSTLVKLGSQMYMELPVSAESYVFSAVAARCKPNPIHGWKRRLRGEGRRRRKWRRESQLDVTTKALLRSVGCSVVVASGGMQPPERAA